MPALAATTTALDTSEPLPVSRKRISKRMQQALGYLATKGVNQREAAKLAGISEFHLSRELKKPQIQVFIERKSREIIATGMMRAANRAVELIDAGSEHVSLDASKHVLGIAGIKPAHDAQVSVNVDIKAGFVIDISEPDKSVSDARVTQRVIDHE